MPTDGILSPYLFLSPNMSCCFPLYLSPICFLGNWKWWLQRRLFLIRKVIYATVLINNERIAEVKLMMLKTFLFVCSYWLVATWLHSYVLLMDTRFYFTLVCFKIRVNMMRFFLFAMTMHLSKKMITTQLFSIPVFSLIWNS